MPRSLRAALALLLLPVTIGARGAAIAPAPSSMPGETPLAQERVLSLYATALAGVLHPPAVTFGYTVEQLGLRNLLQSHRVYRSGLSERDETLAVDGIRLKRPSVRIIAGRFDRYDVERVAPRPNDYAFEFRGAVNESDGYGYLFVATARSTRAFEVSEVEIDGRSFLPRRVRFKLTAASAHGSGELQYAAAERYWVIQSAGLSAHLADGSLAHESIHWSDYHFPKRLPKSIFRAPRPIPTIAPLGATPQPGVPGPDVVPGAPVVTPPVSGPPGSGTPPGSGAPPGAGVPPPVVP